MKSESVIHKGTMLQVTYTPRHPYLKTFLILSKHIALSLIIKATLTQITKGYKTCYLTFENLTLI